MKTPHILIANVFFAPYSYGGATIVAEEVALKLKENHKFIISAISLISADYIAPYSILKVEKKGIVNYLINIPQNRSYSESYNNPRIDDLIARIIDTIEPSLVHVHCVQDMGAGIIGVAKGRGVPVVLSVHDFWWLCERQFMIKPNDVFCAQSPIQINGCKGCVVDFTRAKTRQNHLLNQASLADIITFPSDYALSLGTESNLCAAKNVVWKNGVNPPRKSFFKKQKERREKNAEISFGFVGGPSQIKGWPLINKAFSSISRSNFSGYLVDGSLGESWWNGIDITSMKGQWQIHPRFCQSTMDDFYGKIDVLLFPSQWKETYGLTIREAISRGIRVIQTNSGGTVEHQAANKNEMLEIGQSYVELRKSVERILKKPKEHPKPYPVTTYSDQAQEFKKITKPLFG